MATVFVKNNGDSKIPEGLQGISEERANFMENVMVSCQLVGFQLKLQIQQFQP